LSGSSRAGSWLGDLGGDVFKGIFGIFQVAISFKEGFDFFFQPAFWLDQGHLALILLVGRQSPSVHSPMPPSLLWVVLVLVPSLDLGRLVGFLLLRVGISSYSSSRGERIVQYRREKCSFCLLSTLWHFECGRRPHSGKSEEKREEKKEESWKRRREKPAVAIPCWAQPYQ